MQNTSLFLVFQREQSLTEPTYRYNFVLLMLNTYQYNCLLDAMWKEQEGERRNEGKKIGKKEKTRNLYWASTFVT